MENDSQSNSFSATEPQIKVGPRRRFSKSHIIIAIVVLIWLAILAIAGSLYLTREDSPEGLGTEPLSATSNVDQDGNYISSEDLFVGVTTPEGAGPEESNPSEPQAQPSTSPTPSPNPSPSNPGPPPVETGPPQIGPGDPSQFSVSTYGSQVGTLNNGNTIAAPGYWQTGTDIDTNGANDIRVTANLTAAAAGREDHLAMIVESVNDTTYDVYISLQSRVYRLGNNRGALVRAYKSPSGESPSGVVAPIEFGNGGTEMARLFDWQPGQNYTMIITRDAARSNSQTTWWDAYIQRPDGVDLLIGSFNYPTSVGKLRVRSTYLEQYGGLPQCGSHPLSTARFFNQRNDGVGASNVALHIREYNDCSNLFSHSQLGDNGYQITIRPGN